MIKILPRVTKCSGEVAQRTNNGLRFFAFQPEKSFKRSPFQISPASETCPHLQQHLTPKPTPEAPAGRGTSSLIFKWWLRCLRELLRAPEAVL